MGNVTFLGVEGSGKTVLTTALVKLFRAHEHEGWYLRPESREAFRFYELSEQLLSTGTLPQQTASLRYLAWKVVKDKKPLCKLDILDYPGELYRLAFLDAKDDPDPIGFKERVAAHQDEIHELLEHLLSSEHVFVLFNPEDAQDLSTNAKNLDAVWTTNACLDYLQRLPNHPTITFVVTQVDRYIDIETQEFDPKVYVDHHLPLIAKNFPDLDCLALSALGDGKQTLGLDGILFRSLFETPSIQESLRTLNDPLTGFQTLLIKACEKQKVEDLNALTAAQEKYSAALERLGAMWFFPEEILSGTNLMTYAAIEKDMRLIVHYAQQAHSKCCQAKSLSDYDGCLQALTRQLSTERICSPQGEKWQRAMARAFDVAIKNKKESTERVQNLIVLGVIVIVILCFVGACNAW